MAKQSKVEFPHLNETVEGAEGTQLSRGCAGAHEGTELLIREEE